MMGCPRYHGWELWDVSGSVSSQTGMRTSVCLNTFKIIQDNKPVDLMDTVFLKQKLMSVMEKQSQPFN